MDILIVLLVVLTAITLIGHLIWLGIAAVIRWFFLDEHRQLPEVVPRQDPVVAQLKDLNITERQIVKFYREGKLNDQIYEQVMQEIRAERRRLVTPEPSKPEPVATPAPTPVVKTPPPSVVTASVKAEDQIIIKPAPSFISEDTPARIEPPPTQPPPPPRAPRRSFSEVLNAFMEESNIRWGEIIGGLLIIGCSTALVVSLWAQISQIPVLKFLIFTTVTAILFGIGLYTEHRWKLPTTSRGILTIATLLVPLNFLAIAAVSASNTSGGLVIASELAAPAIFLCLVYFAGRIITPGCAHILSAGVLGSSVGQLLVRHFASIDASPWLLIFLGAFPVTCYVATVGLALRVVLHDREIDDNETRTVFTTLGTMSFAALLPFGLLLYKSGPIGMSMMYLAPLVTLWGLPMLATGTILWRKISNKELVAARTAGTALGIMGLMIVLVGMILAWPNPASIIPAALLNFAVLTTLAIVLELPVAHLIAALCFALAYLVTGHVLAGGISWQNLRVMSLLQVCISVESGTFLVGAVALFVIASDWLSRKKHSLDGRYYTVAACITAIVSLALSTVLAVPEEHALWLIYGIYSLGAFFVAWRRNLVPFTWTGSVLLLFSLVHSFMYSFSFAFPWQTAWFAHATICAIAAIISSRHHRGKVFSVPLNTIALISIACGIFCLFQANQWEVTWMQAQRVFWISGILFLLLWLNRQRIIFISFQISLLCALVLTVKAALQEYDWYSYLPDAFLHPWALQIQGTILALFCLMWIGMRLLARRALNSLSYQSAEKSAHSKEEHWLAAASRLLDSRYAVDTFLVWLLLPAFLLLAVYGALTGVTRELAALGSGYPGFNVADFPHTEALGPGSWILLGLLLLTMLMSYWERRRSAYLLGALTVLSGMVPLLAGLFENQIATATAWRWMAALFLLGGSLVIWFRNRIAQRLSSFGWPSFEGEAFIVEWRTVLFVLTIVPLLVLTVYPAARAIFYLPVESPVSGVFSLLDDDFAYGVPLVLAALTLIGYALRERMPSFAVYAGAFFNATVTLAFLLAVVSAHGPMDRVVIVRVVQLNIITFAVYLLPWLSTRRRWRSGLSEEGLRLADYLLKLQLGVAVVLTILLFVPGFFALMAAPSAAGLATIATGSFLGWLSLLAIVVATVWLALHRTIRLSAYALGGLLLSIACLNAFQMVRINAAAGLHTLTIGVAVTAWLMFVAAELTAKRSRKAPFPLNHARRVFHFGSRWGASSRLVAAIVGASVLFLSLRALGDIKESPWWTIAPLLAITTLAATFTWRTKQRGYIYVAGMLFYLAVSLWWLLVGQDGFHLNEFLLVNLIANSLGAIVWLWLDLRSRKAEASAAYYFSFHNLAAVFLLGVLTLFVIINFFDVNELQAVNLPGLTWLTILSVGTLLVACLLDRCAKYAMAALYTLALVACAFGLQQLQLSPTRFAWSATLVLAGFSLLTALLWHWRARLISLATQLGVPERLSPDATQLRWLSAFTVMAVLTIGILAYCIDLTFVDFSLRVSAGAALAAQFVTFGLLAEGSSARTWRRFGIASLVIGAVLIGWSWLTPGIDATWLNRSVILMVEVFGLTALYGLLLDKANKRFPQWTDAARACVPWLLGAGVLALFFCLGTEVRYQLDFGSVLIHPLSLIAIGGTLVAAVVICVFFALSPNHDPLSLSERGRMKYVYVAEVMAALLFLHVRLTMPWLFTGFLARYWPVVVMTVAYFGVVTSEALRRRQLLVLAQPMERTGAFLPLLPVLGFWIASSEVDFSVLLFVVGGLYGLLSILRRSFLFGALAAVAGNAGLWYAFQRTEDYQFLQHPQLWLVPVALSVLAAAYLNEEKLSEDQMTGLRYLSLVTIYVSSTADIFINGVANSPWLPLILGSFSLAGVFAGILFRIRGMLLLGSVFLLLSVTTMIWYASDNFGWTWLWYVAGIVTGATIIFMFAVFEKKRSEVLRVVEGLKEWDR